MPGQPAFLHGRPALAALQKSERAAREEQRAAEDRRRALSAAQQEATRRQREAAHTDAAAGYQTLLAEVVKDPNLRWIDCRVRSEGTMSLLATGSHSMQHAMLLPGRAAERLLKDVAAEVSNKILTHVQGLSPCISAIY